jgi:large subunit ribosomal protein L4
MKVAALRGALSDRARAGAVHVVENFVTGETPNTKTAITALANFTDSHKVLVVLPADDAVNWYSLRNLGHVHLIEARQLNTYDVLNAEAIIFTSPALDEFLGVPAERTEVPVSDKKAEKKADKTEKAEKSAKADKVEKAPKAKKDDDADEEEEK